jgi:MoaD family protein
MITIKIPALWRPVIGASHVELHANRVCDALDMLVQQFPQLRAQLFDEKGDVHEILNLFVNNEHIRFRGGLAAPLSDGDEVYIVPMITGGSM